MTHRVYVRWPNQRVSDKTVTEDETVARFAFETLQRRSDLAGERAGAAWSANGRQCAFHDFTVHRSSAMSEPAPPAYVAGTPTARTRAAIDVLAQRAEDLDRQIDRLTAGESVGVGVTADYLALQLALARAALELLRAKAAVALEPIVV